jgi:hypothetical protein
VIYLQSQTVLTTPLPDDEVALLDTVTQRYYTLNETGAAIWDLFAEPRSAASAAAMLEEAYDVDAATARASVQQVVDDLARDGLLTAVEPAAG